MKKNPKLLAAAAGLLALAGTGAGTAYAASGNGSAPAEKVAPVGAVSSHTITPAAVINPVVSTPQPSGPGSAPPDTSGANVQQGDQTAPDIATSGGTSSAAEAPESSSESTSAAENNADGPGGHQDPAGNVDHQFQGNE
jgi:hypothetical protein